MSGLFIVVDREGDEHHYSSDGIDDEYYYHYHDPNGSDGNDRLVVYLGTRVEAEFFKPRYIKVFYND